MKELVDNLTNRDRNIQNDCIKVLYEIGERKPALIADYGVEFLALLDGKNNRLVWGAMTAIDTITVENAGAVYAALPKIREIANSGSVITRDHAVNIMIKLASIRKYEDGAFRRLIEQLRRCPPNQLPMYAENAVAIVNEANKAAFIRTLASRLDAVTTDAKRRRLEKVIKKAG